MSNDTLIVGLVIVGYFLMTSEKPQTAQKPPTTTTTTPGLPSPDDVINGIISGIGWAFEHKEEVVSAASDAFDAIGSFLGDLFGGDATVTAG